MKIKRRKEEGGLEGFWQKLKTRHQIWSSATWSGTGPNDTLDLNILPLNLQLV